MKLLGHCFGIGHPWIVPPSIFFLSEGIAKGDWFGLGFGEFQSLMDANHFGLGGGSLIPGNPQNTICVKNDEKHSENLE